MLKDTLRSVILVGLILIVGNLITSLDVVSGADVWHWRLSEIVQFAMFTAAAVIAVDYGATVGDQAERPLLDSASLSRVGGLVIYAVALWFLFKGVDAVLRVEWRDTAEILFALGLVGLAGFALWEVYVGFDEIMDAVERARDQAREERRAGSSSKDSGFEDESSDELGRNSEG